MSRSATPSRHRGRTLVIVVVAAVLAGGAALWLAFGRSGTGGGPTVTGDGVVSEIPGWTPGRGQFANAMEEIDPARGGWDGEVLHDRIKGRLKELAEVMRKGQPTEGDLGDLVASDFSGDPLRPERERVYDGPDLTVDRTAPDQPSPSPVRGGQGLAAAIGTLMQAFDKPDHAHIKFKITGVTPGNGSVETQIVFQSAGPSADRWVQQTSEWTCNWTMSGDTPRLQSIDVSTFEEVGGPPSGRTLFADCTEAMFAQASSFRDQLVPGIDHWCERLDKNLRMTFLGHQGLAIGDVDNDGLEDVYICQPGGLPNRLYVQAIDGTVTDTSAHAGVDYLDLTRSALLVDLDNDGDQDMVLGGEVLAVLANNGEGRFSRVTTLGTTNIYSLTAADYDDDGDLDVYVCRYSATEESAPVPYYDANNGERNLLLRNDGELRFSDVTAETGLDQNNRRYSFAAAWIDFDDDGDQDLYVANDFGRNNLFRNDNGRFEDVAATLGVEDISAGMSVAWGDYDNDGRFDLYVSNMFSAAGSRITFDRRFGTDLDAAERGSYQRHARGNSLFRSTGPETFEDVSVSAAVTRGRWAWGSRFVDINNDSREDIVVANGFVSNEDTKDL